MGDLAGHTKSLVAELKKIKYNAPVSWEMLLIGETTVFLPILHHTLLLYSQDIANEILKKGYRLYSCTDQRFIESVFKLARREFQQKPVLTVEQFLRKGFAEHKIIFLLNIIRYCRTWESKLKPVSKKSNNTMKKKNFNQNTARHSQRNMNASIQSENHLRKKEALRLKILEKSRLKKDIATNNNVKIDHVNNNNNNVESFENNNKKYYDEENNQNNLEHQIDQLKNLFVMNINQINESITTFANAINTRLSNLENRVGNLEAKSIP